MSYPSQEFNLPTILTLTRLILSPVILPALLVALLPYNILIINFLLAVIFAGFSLTDYFDGYFARKLNQETSFGRLLDPVADKLLVSSTLVALVAAGKFWFYWAIIWIAREFFVMGLRQRAAEQGTILHVLSYGKIKTAIQLVCLTFVILNPMHAEGYSAYPWWNMTELFLTLSATLLSVASAYRYYVAYNTQCTTSMREHDQANEIV